jgi:anti-sigma factor RsiW
MDCRFTENISLLMDGELSGREAIELRSHLAGCSLCQQAEKDFHLLRQEIQAYQPEADPIAQRRALSNLLDRPAPLSNKPLPFWRRKIALPVPALALVALLVLALSLWAIYPRLAKSPQQNFAAPPARMERGREANPFDLSRFDKGGRAMIYTARRTAANDQPRREGNQ